MVRLANAVATADRKKGKKRAHKDTEADVEEEENVTAATEDGAQAIEPAKKSKKGGGKKISDANHHVPEARAQDEPGGGSDQEEAPTKKRATKKDKNNTTVDATIDDWENGWDGLVAGMEVGARRQRPQAEVDFCNLIETEATASSSSSRLPNGKKRPFPDGSEGWGRDLWLRQLKELQARDPRREFRVPATAEPPTEAALTSMLHNALRTGDWTPVVNPEIMFKHSIVADAVRRIPLSEAFRHLRALSKFFLSHPQQRMISSVWMAQTVEQLGDKLIGRSEFHEILRPLLQAIVRRIGKGNIHYKVLGKFKLLCLMADVRWQFMKSMEQAKATAAQGELEEEGDGYEEDENDAQECEQDEECQESEEE